MGFATALMTVGIGMQAGGAIYAGRQQEAEYKASQRMDEYNADVAEQQAKAIEIKARFDQIRQAQAAQRIMGSLYAKMGASGARMDVGAPFLIASEQEAELELENLMIGYEAKIEAGRWLSQAQISRMRGKVAKMRAKYAKRAGYMKAGTSLLTGFGTMYEQGMLDFGGTPSYGSTRLGQPGVSGPHIP